MTQSSKKEGLQGTVFDIQRYSIHDGPGIRTTVFVKGCPLRCKWCSNPESQNSYPEVLFSKAKCDGCGKCVEVCPLGAIILDGDGIHIDRAKCDRCMKCLDVCYPHAIRCAGERKSVEEVIEEVSKDELFYRNSGGGVTISGGEPLFQPQFTLALLKECKERQLHTALDTCGFANWKEMEGILDYTDLVLFDIKHLDPEMHLMGTGLEMSLSLKTSTGLLKRGKEYG